MALGFKEEKKCRREFFWVIWTLRKFILWLASIDLIDQVVQIDWQSIPLETQTNNAFRICIRCNRKFFSPHVAFETQHWPLTWCSIWHVLLKTSAVWAQYYSGSLSEPEFKLILVYLSTNWCARLGTEEETQTVCLMAWNEGRGGEGTPNVFVFCIAREVQLSPLQPVCSPVFCVFISLLNSSDHESTTPGVWHHLAGCYQAKTLALLVKE